MSDTITVEVDGELGEPDYLPERPRPSWGMPVAVVVIVLLVVGLGWTLLSGGKGATEPAATPTPTVVPTSTPTTAPPVSTSTTTTAAPPPVDEPEVDLTDPVHVAEAALDAWGEFAASGDLAIIEPFFDPAGPQYAQLQSEIAAGGPEYDIVVAQPQVVVDGDVARVDATVTWRRDGEPDQRYEWSIELRRGGAEWRLWTVRTIG